MVSTFHSSDTHIEDHPELTNEELSELIVNSWGLCKADREKKRKLEQTKLGQTPANYSINFKSRKARADGKKEMRRKEVERDGKSTLADDLATDKSSVHGLQTSQLR